MSKLRYYRTFQQTLAAGESVKVPGMARYVRCIQSTDPFKIGIDDAPDAYIDQGLGFELPGDQTFSSLRLTNPSAGFNLIILGLGLGRMSDSRANLISAIDLTKSARLQTGIDVALPSGAQTLLFADDSTRRTVVVAAPASNVMAMRIGGVGPFSNQGIDLPPGERIEIATSGELFAYNPHAYSQTLSFIGVHD